MGELTDVASAKRAARGLLRDGREAFVGVRRGGLLICTVGIFCISDAMAIEGIGCVASAQ